MNRTICRTAIFLLSAAALLASGPIPFTGEHEEWNGLIDQVRFLEDGPWGGRYETLVVEEMDTSRTVVEGKKRGRQAAEDARKLVGDWCGPALLEGLGKTAFRVLEAKNAPPR